MSIPAEIAWIIPIAIPFAIGLLIGLIAKRTAKLIILISALIVLLTVTGYISLTFSDVYDKAAEILPKMVGGAMVLVNLLPYSSMAFLAGLALGLWKG